MANYLFCQDHLRPDLKLSYTSNLNKSSPPVLNAADNLTNYKNVYYQEYRSESSSLKTHYQFGIFPIWLTESTFEVLWVVGGTTNGFAITWFDPLTQPAIKFTLRIWALETSMQKNIHLPD